VENALPPFGYSDWKDEIIDIDIYPALVPEFRVGSFSWCQIFMVPDLFDSHFHVGNLAGLGLAAS
jgi:hypothetical protein